MDLAIIVPCRLASQRFPKKLLHKVLGKELILWTADRIKKEVPELPLFFAVDDPSIKQILKENGYKTVMTHPDHESGTDRIAEANNGIKAEYVINVQGDEPLITGEQIRKLGELIQTNVDMATLATPFKSNSDFHDPNQVKVVLAENRQALYFSRSPIPYSREHKGMLQAASPALRHLGLYAYSANFLIQFRSLKQGYLENIEKLEQLRAIENGFKIGVGITHTATIGIDSPEDVSKLEAALKSL
jgi:3-deoxy-manno-octulosonate cytidylyltransferase (CMP-KDO synthetase)|tara:strand:+ start:10189 stop:10923 length:735 start_codon:yes stop_codon:yes gene_type:complete